MFSLPPSTHFIIAILDNCGNMNFAARHGRDFKPPLSHGQRNNRLIYGPSSGILSFFFWKIESSYTKREEVKVIDKGDIVKKQVIKRNIVWIFLAFVICPAGTRLLFKTSKRNESTIIWKETEIRTYSLYLKFSKIWTRFWKVGWLLLTSFYECDK